jgi:arsenate reductase
MPRILILSTANSIRGPMAEATLREYDPNLQVFSAGVDPAAEVHPVAVCAMQEIGIDIGDARPKGLDAFAGQRFDYVITVCDAAQAACPVFPGAVRRFHFPFDDLSAVRGTPEQALEAFRHVRDQIGVRLRDFYLGRIRASAPRLRPARQGDLEALVGLISECGLNAEGIGATYPAGYAVVDSAGELVGAAGVEIYGEDGLLRSVTVAADRRGSGLGALLVRNRLQWAVEQRLRAVYVLTLASARFFERLGFWRVEREEAPEGIRGSELFRSARPTTAALLCLTLR